MASLDIARCRRGMKQIEIEGTPRPQLIEVAIAAIHSNPKDAMREEYFGIKNYAGFGDQREDSRYGYGPRHGTIVFRIGRAAGGDYNGDLDGDAIYLLEAARDFGSLQIEDRYAASPYERTKALNLCGVINRLDRLNADAKVLADAIGKASVDSHAAEAANA